MQRVKELLVIVVYFQILCFTAVSLANEFESEIIHRNSKEKKGRCAVDSFPWDEERLKLLLVLVRLSDLQLVQLWEPPSISIMEDLATLFASICYKFLENPTVARDKVLLDNISALLGATLQKHGLTLSKLACVLVLYFLSRCYCFQVQA